MFNFALNYLENKAIMNFEERRNTLYKLGAFLDAFLRENSDLKSLEINDEDIKWFEHQVNLAISLNPWFTKENVYLMLNSWADALKSKNIETWLGKYKIADQTNNKGIGVVMAGNIPMVGFHDLLSVFVSGNRFLGKLSSDDKILIPALIEILKKFDSKISSNIKFTQNNLENFDAIIATGSNNTARYFEYYFGKYPNIIRKNRNGVGVINGNESKDELEALGLDIFSFFGLGCRNVSKLYVPENYSFQPLFKAFEKYAEVATNHKYVNNYDFNKSIYLVNGEQHFDNGFLLLKEDEKMVSPISVVYFEYYKDVDELNQKFELLSEDIQCIVSQNKQIKNSFNFGDSQKPELWDYADGVDTLEFLLNL